LLNMLTLRFILLMPLGFSAPAAALSCFFRRHRRKAPSTIAATPSREPTTAPAIAPSESPFCTAWESACASTPGVTMGVDVTVSVTLAPDRVTTRTLVIGDGIGVGVMEVLDSVVGTGPGAM